MSDLTITGMYCAWKGIPMPNAEVITDRDPGDEHVPSRLDLRPSAAVVPIRSSALADWLRELADRADAGEFIAAGAALVTRRGAATVAWFDPSKESRVGLIAGSSVLAHGLIADARENAQEG